MVMTLNDFTQGKKETLNEHLNDSLKYHLGMLNQTFWEYHGVIKDMERKMSSFESEEVFWRCKLMSKTKSL